MQVSAGLLLFIFLVQTLAFMVKALAGFGDAVVSSPLLALGQMQNEQISPLALLLSFPTNLILTLRNRKHFSFKSCFWLLFFNIAGMVPGMFLLAYSSSGPLKLGLGVVIVALGCEMLLRSPAKPAAKSNFAVMGFVVALSGFISGIYGINLLFVAYIERTVYNNRGQFRGQVSFIFLIENTVRIIGYALLGLFTTSLLLPLVVSLLGMLTGLLLGGLLDKRLKEAHIRRIIPLAFVLSGLSLLIKAILGLWGKG